MASAKKRAVALRSIGKAARAAKRKRTVSKPPKATRTALGKKVPRGPLKNDGARADRQVSARHAWLGCFSAARFG